MKITMIMTALIVSVWVLLGTTVHAYDYDWYETFAYEEMEFDWYEDYYDEEEWYEDYYDEEEWYEDYYDEEEWYEDYYDEEEWYEDYYDEEGWYEDDWEDRAVERYMTETDCFEDEYYDAEQERCFPQDENYSEYAESELNYPTNESLEQEYSLSARYSVDTTDSLTLDSWITDAKHLEVRNLFAAMIPATVRGDLVEVWFIHDRNDDTAAYVEQRLQDHTTWKVVFNVDAYYIDGKLDLNEWTHTNIHEFAHILTLQKSQTQLIPLDIDNATYDTLESTCTTYFVQEGCLKETSYFKAYIDAFWDRDELDRVWSKENPDAYTPQEYVSDYAPTNPGEDIAESFTHFVLYEKPTGTSEADQKRSFFYAYPELVKLRDTIRSNMK